MSTTTKGDCCVCGEETTKRCGACQSAGVDLFFCSREHQKLVWKTHGKVCGANSNPFRQPDFTHDEIELAKRHMHTVVFNNVMVVTEKDEQASRSTPLRVSPAMVLCAHIGRSSPDLEQGAPSVLASSDTHSWSTEGNRSSCLFLCRVLLFAAELAPREEIAPCLRAHHLSTLDPFTLAAGLESTLLLSDAPLAASNTQVKHLTLILFSLLHRLHTDTSAPSSDTHTALARFCLHAYQQLLNALLKQVPIDDSATCRFLIERALRVFGKELFLKDIALCKDTTEQGQVWIALLVPQPVRSSS
ncbi:hypothetical protein JCM10207_001666 [Rhodosporidiobolus poonsookiae]